jgi:hypothetical protein
MAKGNADKKKDRDLRECAEAFLKSYSAAAVTSEADLQRILEGGRFGLFDGGAVELDDEVRQSLSKLVARAGKLLGAKAGSEKTICDLAHKHGRDHILGKNSQAQAVTNLKLAR